MEPELAILVVDDEFDVAELLAELLAARGHRATSATNGVIAQGLLASADYDVVITDFMMPLMDGVELVGWMRANARLAGVPVIMISAQRDLPEAARALVQATLQKPFSPAALYAAIARVRPPARP